MDSVARAVVMVRSAAFGYNEETAGTNAFQHRGTRAVGVQATAQHEFDRFAGRLAARGVDVLVLPDAADPPKPDAVYPNNWFSTHAGGLVIIYPLMAANRRPEKRTAALRQLLSSRGYAVERVLDLGRYEGEGRYLEGTGSLVLDHVGRTAYAALSPRTDETLVRQVAEVLGYEPVVFTTGTPGRAVYHTNVMMAVGNTWAAVCPAWITETREREKVLQRLSATGRHVLALTKAQVRSFAGNVLCLAGRSGEVFTVMSESAYGALEPAQREVMAAGGPILAVPLPVIERVGGGSVRCMLAEVFLEKRKKIKANL